MFLKCYVQSNLIIFNTQKGLASALIAGH